VIAASTTAASATPSHRPLRDRGTGSSDWREGAGAALAAGGGVPLSLLLPVLRFFAKGVSQAARQKRRARFDPGFYGRFGG
jgi:hypothetical protein